jgi:2,4-dienoyl-CoA reductase-like NADH-dependent reductase (Old Yellow Enzyme family)
MEYTVYEAGSETHVPKELAVEEIEALVERFAEAAERAGKAGFDMVEIHGAHGYLIYQFLSPLNNKRTDAYGGDLAGRAKFALDIIGAATKRMPDLPLIFRISVDEYAEGGVTPEESRQVCEWAQEAGADAIHVSAGSYFSPYPYMVPTMMSAQGCYLHLAELVKKSVGVPVIAAGRMHDPFLAERAIQEGKTDMVALGRQLITDAEWPNKVREGRLDEVRKCISCNYCIEAMREGAQVECACNTEVGTEWLQAAAANQGG